MQVPNQLAHLLSMKRGYGGAGENLAAAYIRGQIQETVHTSYEDGFGNVVCVTDKTSRSLFSSHIDTVHRDEGKVKWHYDAPYIKTDGKSPLGADDATGIYIMLQMIIHGVPGTYVFHRGEEVGGLGSDWIVENSALDFKLYDRAIAFDRKGTADIITHQCFRCCSNQFAEALGDQLLSASSLKINMIPDDSGIFTDTANYTEDIPECTNLSVGYYHEHTVNEIQNLPFLVALVAACLKVKWEELPTKRIAEPTSWGNLNGDQDVIDQDFEQMVECCETFPREVAAILLRDGYDAFELIHTIEDYMPKGKDK